MQGGEWLTPGQLADIRSAKAERNALRNALLEMVLQFEGIARPGRLSVSVADAKEAKKTVDLAKAALDARAIARRAVDDKE